MNTAQQLLPEVNWFDVSDPNSSDLDELARRFHLHELQIEDCRHRPQPAKVDEYGTYMFAVLKHLVHKDQVPEFDGRVPRSSFAPSMISATPLDRYFFARTQNPGHARQHRGAGSFFLEHQSAYFGCARAASNGRAVLGGSSSYPQVSLTG